MREDKSKNLITFQTKNMFSQNSPLKLLCRRVFLEQRKYLGSSCVLLQQQVVFILLVFHKENIRRVPIHRTATGTGSTQYVNVRKKSYTAKSLRYNSIWPGNYTDNLLYTDQIKDRLQPI